MLQSIRWHFKITIADTNAEIVEWGESASHSAECIYLGSRRASERHEQISGND